MKGRRKARLERRGPPFVQLPKYMLDSPAWLGLSLAARCVYVEVEKVYNGSNNGMLGVGVRALADRLRCSKNTAARALIELEDAGFVVTVKLGGFSRHHRQVSQYRLEIHRCDLSGNLPSKTFMQPTVPEVGQYGTSGGTVEAKTPSKEASRSHLEYRQDHDDASHCPTSGTLIESHHGGVAVHVAERRIAKQPPATRKRRAGQRGARPQARS